MLNFKELGLSPNLLKAVETLGFDTPTPVQEKIIPLVLESEKDITGLANTGTGKTAAFGLPLIEKINLQKKKTQVLILSPTRELCIQISRDIENFSRFTKGLRVVAVYGGASIDSQIRSINSGAHIIVATPGRMLDLIKRKKTDISEIQSLVLDEADEMLNMGFREDLDAILERTPVSKQTLLFSATMPAEVARIASRYMKDPVQVTLGKQNSGADNISHTYYLVRASDRYLALKRIVDYHPDIYGIVFCRTRAETKTVAAKLIKDGYNADAIHGDLSQSQRDSVMTHFRDRSLQMLVATDVAARGIDVSDITHVINYNLPDEPEIYTHRTGRTGRANKSGEAISLVNHREKSRIPGIEKQINKKCVRKQIPDGFSICEKQLFSLVDRMEKAEVEEDQIAAFMPSVIKKLDSLSKEDIIKRFLSLEFNRFLDYYRDSKDLNPGKDESHGSQERGRGRSGKRRKDHKNTPRNRFFLNLGKKDRIDARNVIGMINDYTQDRDIDIGSIDILNSFSFFEVDQDQSAKILAAFAGKKYKGRSIVVQPASEKKEKKEKRKKPKRKSGMAKKY